MAIRSWLHKETQELIKRCWLPQLEELRKNLVMEELVDNIQENTSHRWEVTKLATKVTMELIEQNLIYPTKFHTMIQVFMATLSKDTLNLKENIAMHTKSLEELAYLRISTLYDQLEMWTTYIWDKSPWKRQSRNSKLLLTAFYLSFSNHPQFCLFPPTCVIILD